jgi:hypothetical protein
MLCSCMADCNPDQLLKPVRALIGWRTKEGLGIPFFYQPKVNRRARTFLRGTQTHSHTQSTPHKRRTPRSSLFGRTLFAVCRCRTLPRSTALPVTTDHRPPPAALGRPYPCRSILTGPCLFIWRYYSPVTVFPRFFIFSPVCCQVVAAAPPPTRLDVGCHTLAA